MAPDTVKLTADLRELASGPRPEDEHVQQSLLEAATQLVRHLQTPAERILRMCWSHGTMFAAIRVLIDLGIFPILSMSDSPKKVEELAIASGADPKLLSRLLKHIVTEDLVEETGPDEYAANDVTKALASTGGQGSVKDCYLLMKMFDHFPTFLKETQYNNPTDNTNTAFQHAYKTSQHFFAYINAPGHEEKIEAFKQHMAYKTTGLKWYEDKAVVQDIFGSREYSPEEVMMVDLGGASGHDLVGFKEAHPDMKGRLILQDLPDLINTIDSKALAIQGVEAMGHDMLTPQPIQGAKVYYLKYVLHDWPAGECKQALANLKPALKPGYSRILLNEIVIPAVKANWIETSVDMLMMIVHAAQERREEEWRELIESQGLKLVKLWDIPGALEKLIEIDLA